MPETTVCENGDLGRGKYKVRASWQFRRTYLPTPDSELDEVGAYPALSRRIIRGPYSAHVATASGRRIEVILHNSSTTEIVKG
jgi:hypothetical protein